MSDLAATAPSKPKRGALFLRLGIAHAIAYPVAIAWSVAAIPLCVISVPEKLLADIPVDIDPWKFAHDFGAGARDAGTAALRLILLRIIVAATVPFLLEHLLVLPWAVRGSDRTRRFSWWSTAAITGIAILGGGASWLWLVLR